MKLFTYFLVLFAITSCVNQPTAPAQRTLTLIYSGNMDGELEPCGCSEGGNKGGIKRRAYMLDELRTQQPDLFLISTGGLLISEMPQDKLKSEYILKGLSALNYDALGVQWQDLAYGTEFLLQNKLPFVSSNRIDGQFNKQRLISHGNVSLAYFQWLDPDAVPAKTMDHDRGLSGDSQALVKMIDESKRQGHITVLATTLKLIDAKALLPLEKVDILLIEAAYEKIGEPQKIGNTLVLQPGSRGMRLGRADLTIDQNGNILDWKHDVIALPETVPDAQRMLAWYDDYNNQVKVDYQKRVEQRKALMSGATPYAGEKACETCHSREHEIWFETPHAEAFFKLMDVNKSFDPSCIGCHTVGFEKQGGYIDYMLTKNLANVQCENCHGAAKAHVDSKGSIATENKTWQPQQMCAQCHVQKHSPDFKYETYWPRIAHGKLNTKTAH